ncbi:MAG: DNA methylase [Oscillospiraceae bacterium]|nr:DNA methylase [Oscillospiraceae bacterium]
MERGRTYIAIDLKSFYASQECVARGWDPLRTNLVVADASRTDKTICLAVTPALKTLGVPGRPRLFEVNEILRQKNAIRRGNAPGRKFRGKSCDIHELAADPSLEIDLHIVPPRMSHYVECSTKIFEIYMKYVAPEDIHVYSIDEVFIDATAYLHAYDYSALRFTRKLIGDVLDTTGITATAGIGTNLYLAKIAMDIVAKKMEPDAFGVRIAELDEHRYREQLWDHTPLTDFWRVGRGTAQRLATHRIYTMGDIARCSIGKAHEHHNEELLYRLLGVNAELLIDHAWGWEPCTIGDIKAYRPRTSCLSSGQVLHHPYSYEKAALIVREMADALSMDLVEKRLETDQLTLTVGYDRESLKDGFYTGSVTKDHYGRSVPTHGHGTVHLDRRCSSTERILKAVSELYSRIADPQLLVRRLNLTANVYPEGLEQFSPCEQFSLFEDNSPQKEAKEKEALEREKRRQQAILHIRKKFGKNAILKGMNLEKDATAVERNGQIGGHRA